MTTNPYQPPDAALERKQSIGDEQIPLDILSKIKRGWITLGILSGLHLIMGSWGEGLVYLALTYGLYKRNRFAATFVFGTNVLGLLALAFVERDQIDEANILILFVLLIGIIFLYIFYHAMISTYRYRKIIN